MVQVGFYWFIEHNLLNYYDDWTRRLSDTFGNSRALQWFIYRRELCAAAVAAAAPLRWK